MIGRRPVPLWPLVLVLTVPVVMVVGALALGFLFPWEPPDTRDAPQEAVLRVISPAGEPYRIIWGFDVEEFGEVESGLTYRDHEVPPEAGSPDGDFSLALSHLDNEAGREWDGQLQAILFVRGRYATCSGSGTPFLRLYWRSSQYLGNPLVRATCGKYRYDPSTLRL
ncbi:MAG: hypothetical protein ACFB50_16850 [Rubrobacteraceae bacterium]